MNISGISPSPTFYNNPYQPRVNPNGITWVQGVEGAKAFQLLPNSNAILMDSESDKFYIKSSDNVGMCSLRTFNFVEEIEKPKEEYITKTEFDSYMAQFKEQYEQLIQANSKSGSSKQIQHSSNTGSDGTSKQ